MEMQRRSVEGSLGLCKVLGDFVPMGFRASVCIYLLNTNCLQDGKRIGVPSVVVLRILGGVLVRANGAGVGLEARRRFCPPCGVGQWFVQRAHSCYLNLSEDSKPAIAKR